MTRKALAILAAGFLVAGVAMWGGAFAGGPSLSERSNRKLVEPAGADGRRRVPLRRHRARVLVLTDGRVESAPLEGGFAQARSRLAKENPVFERGPARGR